MRRIAVLGTRPASIAALSLLFTVVTAGCGAEETNTAPTTPPPTTTMSTPTVTPTAPGPIATTPTVDPFADVPLIDHVEWVQAVDGPRLLVHPSPAGRRTTFPGSDERAWREVLTAAPNANTAGMRDQFICHWVWARLVTPDKPTWNLEPWRPNVGYDATVEAACNPGGPER
ncbi:DUF2599 domain-containing protein [Nocardia brevicatena]|uniref:DUF2599 domain-containing protein n=1 Tax=Nocardia brevicatena TaxID=37327 RepID=UPI0002D659E4|nr:DUF2599 domain-containing protein [Nocardia brevicatena]